MAHRYLPLPDFHRLDWQPYGLRAETGRPRSSAERRRISAFVALTEPPKGNGDAPSAAARLRQGRGPKAGGRGLKGSPDSESGSREPDSSDGADVQDWLDGGRQGHLNLDQQFLAGEGFLQIVPVVFLAHGPHITAGADDGHGGPKLVN